MILDVKKESNFKSTHFSKKKDYYVYLVILGVFYYFYQWHITDESWRAFIFAVQERVGSENVEFVVSNLVTLAITIVSYWTLTGSMMFLEYFPLTAPHIAKYKTQPVKSVPLSQIAHAAWGVLINQMIVSAPFGYLFYRCLVYRGNSIFTPLPTPTTIALHLAFFTLMIEIGKSHSLTHSPVSVFLSE